MMPRISFVRKSAMLLCLATLLAPTGDAQYDQAPWVNIQPISDTSLVSTVSVSILWCGGEGFMYSSSRVILFNGNDVRGQFTYEPATIPDCSTAAYSHGVITLSPGDNMLQAEISDEDGDVGAMEAPYFFGPVYAVEATPDGGTVTRPKASGQVESFTVKNTSNVAATIALSPSCAGDAVTPGCMVSPTTLSLGVNAQATASVSYTTGPPNSTGRITLVASVNGVSDEATVDVTIPSDAVVINYPTVDLSKTHPGATLERDLCLSVAVGASAAYGEPETCGAPQF